MGYVSIPQAVSTVATHGIKEAVLATSFNTASGKYCCNCDSKKDVLYLPPCVSIPQAVSTVATWLS